MGVLEIPLENTSVADEMFDPSLCVQAIRLRELALKEKQLELKNAKLELRKHEMDHQSFHHTF